PSPANCCCSTAKPTAWPADSAAHRLLPPQPGLAGQLRQDLRSAPWLQSPLLDRHGEQHMPWYIEALLSIPAGLLLGNFVEWFFHKYVLHGLGKTRGTFWSFHFHEHHRNARRHDFYDPCYRRFPLGWH